MNNVPTTAAIDRLSIRDLITVGLLSLLMLVLFMVLMTAFFLVSAIYPLAMAVAAIPCGAVMMLLLSKVPKTGTLFLCGAAFALMMMVTGHNILTPLVLVSGALVAELLWNVGRHRFTAMAVGYGVLMAGYTLGAFAPFIFLGESAFAQAVARGYGNAAAMETAMQLITPVTALIFAGITFGGAWLGAAFGRRVLRKHFAQAGRV